MDLLLVFIVVEDGVVTVQRGKRRRRAQPRGLKLLVMCIGREQWEVGWVMASTPMGGVMMCRISIERGIFEHTQIKKEGDREGLKVIYRASLVTACLPISCLLVAS
jgi:hypothetical protein